MTIKAKGALHADVRDTLRLPGGRTAPGSTGDPGAPRANARIPCTRRLARRWRVPRRRCATQHDGDFTSREAAEEYAPGDPFVLNGMVKSRSIHEWADALGRL